MQNARSDAPPDDPEPAPIRSRHPGRAPSVNGKPDTWRPRQIPSRLNFASCPGRRKFLVARQRRTNRPSDAI